MTVLVFFTLHFSAYCMTNVALRNQQVARTDRHTEFGNVHTYAGKKISSAYCPLDFLDLALVNGPALLLLLFVFFATPPPLALRLIQPKLHRHDAGLQAPDIQSALCCLEFLC